MDVFEPDTDHLLVTLEDRVATLTLNRPETRNALSDEMRNALQGAIAWAARCPEVGAVLLTGAGAGFCSGADIKRGGAQQSPTLSQDAQYKQLVARHKAIAGALHSHAKPTIAALPGPAVGAGLSIALSCDIRIVADSAFLMTGYARRGLSGDYGIAWLLARLMGPSWSRYYLLTGERIEAARALELGLVHDVVPFDELREAARAMASQLAEGPPIAYGYMKQNLDEALAIDHPTAIEREADRLVKCYSTEDAKEAAIAFREKRPPRYQGR